MAVRTAERVGRAREHVLLTLVSGNGNECVLLLGGSVLEGDCAAAAALAAAADDDANREEVEPGRRALHQLPGEALPAGLRRGQERKWLLRYHVASEAERGAQQAWQRQPVAVPSAVCLTPEPWEAGAVYAGEVRPGFYTGADTCLSGVIESSRPFDAERGVHAERWSN